MVCFRESLSGLTVLYTVKNDYSRKHPIEKLGLVTKFANPTVLSIQKMQPMFCMDITYVCEFGLLKSEYNYMHIHLHIK